jgi:hypothetical protein
LQRLTVGFPPEETLQGAEYIRWVQASLNRVLALRLPVNGILGPETRSAVRRFQGRERLPVTGVVGPDTERALIAALARITPAEPAEPEPSDGELDDLEFAGDSGEWGEEVADFLQEENGARRRARRRTAPVTRRSCRAANIEEVFGVPRNVVRRWDSAFLKPDGRDFIGVAHEMFLLTGKSVDATHLIEVNPAFLAVNALAETDPSNRLRPKLYDMAKKLVDFECRLINTLEGASLPDRFRVWQRLAPPLQWALVRLSFKGDFASAQRILQRCVRDIKRRRNPLCNFPRRQESTPIREAVIRAAQALHLANTLWLTTPGGKRVGKLVERSVPCPLECRTSRPPARRRRQD